jgi:2,3-bisphosphoglycerate-dependent phosphoglycerate mutase
LSAYKDCQLVILRHGESEWNRSNLFTGWRDVKLTAQGEGEAREAGRVLAREGFHFDIAYTSLLSRAILTLWLALQEMDRMWIPVVKDWRLNERHYGKLQGSDKVEAVKRFGEAQVHEWRRGYATRPPLVDLDSPDYPKADPRYAGLDAALLPRGECLKDVLERVVPYWEETIVPQLKSGKRVLIAAHGNSLRALIKHLEGISDAAIAEVDIPTGAPKAYRLDSQFKAARSFFLGDAGELEKRIKAVKDQTRRA